MVNLLVYYRATEPDGYNLYVTFAGHDIEYCNNKMREFEKCPVVDRPQVFSDTHKREFVVEL